MINRSLDFDPNLNCSSTLCATTRVICCILENFQVGDFNENPALNGGIVVPEALRSFMPRRTYLSIPFAFVFYLLLGILNLSFSMQNIVSLFLSWHPS